MPSEAVRDQQGAPTEQPPWRLRWPRLLPLALPLAVFLWSGLRGLDFGRHWDQRLHIRSVSEAVGHGTLLPEAYFYPSVCFWTCTLGLAPEILSELDLTRKGAPVFRASVASFAQSEAFSLRARGIFVVATSLMLLWVYLLVLRWRDSWPEALCAASIMGFSWELAYHARWISPDPLLVMFTAASMTFTAFALRRGASRRWLFAAALAAGLGCGTKYQGGLLIVPVLLAAWYRARVLRVDTGVLRRVMLLAALFVSTYLVTTPGTLLEPVEFARGVKYELRHYGKGHYGFNIEPGMEHLVASLRYLGASLFSPYSWGALSLMALALVGAVATWRDSRALAWLLCGVPLFIGLYMTQFRVFFVRNLLWTAPFLAVLAARGVGVVAGRARSGWPRALVVAPVALVLLANAVFLVRAGESIRDRGTDRFVRELAQYLDARPERLYYLSPEVAGELTALDGKTRANVTLDPSAAVDAAAFYPGELKPVREWTSNVPGLLIRAFGPREVNFEYYATWMEPRILLVARERALELGVLE